MDIRSIMFIFLFNLLITCQAQTTKDTVTYIIREDDYPRPMIGEEKFEQLILEKVNELKNKKLIDCNGTESKSIYLSFKIDRNGLPDNLEILRGINPGLDSAVIKFIQDLDVKWTAGKNEGILRTVSFQICKTRIEE